MRTTSLLPRNLSGRVVAMRRQARAILGTLGKLRRPIVPLALLLCLLPACGTDKHRVLEVKVAPHGKASAKLSSGIASFFSGSGAVELEGGDTGSSARYESWPCRCRPKDGVLVEPAK